MSEATITGIRRQVLQTGAYEPAEASCSITLPVAEDISSDDAEKMIEQWGSTLDIANYEALGIAYEVTEQGIRRLSKSVSGDSTPAPVAAGPSGNTPPRAPTVGGSPLDREWQHLMENKSEWWDPNWQKKLDPDSNFNKNGPDYKRRSDGKGLWLTKKDGTSLVPSFFVCPFTGKNSSELSAVGKEIRV